MHHDQLRMHKLDDFLLVFTKMTAVCCQSLRRSWRGAYWCNNRPRYISIQGGPKRKPLPNVKYFSHTPQEQCSRVGGANVGGEIRDQENNNNNSGSWPFFVFFALLQFVNVNIVVWFVLLFVNILELLLESLARRHCFFDFWTWAIICGLSIAYYTRPM